MCGIQKMARVLPFNMLFAAIRTLCNAVATSRRFNGKALPCLFCGLAAGDDIRHMYCCMQLAASWDLAFPKIPLQWLDHNPRDRFRFFICAGMCSQQEILILIPTLLPIDCVYTVYNSLKFGRVSNSKSQMWSDVRSENHNFPDKMQPSATL